MIDSGCQKTPCQKTHSVAMDAYFRNECGQRKILNDHDGKIVENKNTSRNQVNV